VQLPAKAVPETTYTVSGGSGTLNPTRLLISSSKYSADPFGNIALLGFCNLIIFTVSDSIVLCSLI